MVERYRSFSVFEASAANLLETHGDLPKQEIHSAACSTPREQRKTEKVVITIATTSRPGFFSASLSSEILVKSSRQPMCDAARVLHRRGFPDDTLMVSFWEGSNHESMRGLLGDLARG